jgi:hypothetical protein
MKSTQISNKNYNNDRLLYSWIHFERYFSQLDLLENVPRCFIVLGVLYVTLQVIGFLMIFENNSPSYNPARTDDRLGNESINDHQNDYKENSIEIPSLVDSSDGHGKNSIGVR